MKIIGISGSLREGSFNTLLLNEAKKLAPEGMVIDIYSISDIPLYNGDVEARGFPEAVKNFRAAIEKSDGVLIATPEYGHSIPGVLKNALDWASRRPNQPFNGKPAGIIGATPGNGGTLFAQTFLREQLNLFNCFVMNYPTITISGADSKFGKNGELTDQKTKESLKDFMVSFKNWVALTKDLNKGN